MIRKFVLSSNLLSVGYDYNAEILQVEFRNGSVYNYYEVKPFIYEGLMSASSHGRFFDAYIKKAGYAYRQVG